MKKKLITIFFLLQKFIYFFNYKILKWAPRQR